MPTRGKFITAAIAAGAVLACAAPAGSAPSTMPGPTTLSPTDTLRLDRDIRKTLDYLGGHVPPCGDQYRRMVELASAPAFDTLPVDTRRPVMRALIVCQKDQTSPEGLALLRRLEPVAASPDDIADLNEVLLDDDARNDREARAARRLIVVIDNDPERVANWWPRYLDAVTDGAKDDPALGAALLQRLVALDWKDAASRREAANRWAFDYALLLADRGDLKTAEQVLARADEPEVLMDVAQDRRFEALWPRFQAAGRFDWRRVREADLARQQVQMIQGGGMADASGIIERLRELQRYDDAIALGQAAQAAFTPDSKVEDGEWALNELGYALLEVGRVDEARVAFEQSIKVAQANGSAVSQQINWAGMLVSLGRYREALAEIGKLDADGASDYGRMWADAVRVCANGELNPAAAATLANAMKAREDDNPVALGQALLCLDRQDEVAALYIRRLASPATRTEALSAFRKERKRPVLTPRQVEMERRRQAVLARPEVVRALEAVGRFIDVDPARPRPGGP